MVSHEHKVAAASLIDQLLSDGITVSERLLDEDVLACLKGGHGDCAVRSRRSRDGDSSNIISVE